MIGGYLHYALSDLTGCMPQQLVLKAGFQGYAPIKEEELWGR